MLSTRVDITRSRLFSSWRRNPRRLQDQLVGGGATRVGLTHAFRVTSSALAYSGVTGDSANGKSPPSGACEYNMLVVSSCHVRREHNRPTVPRFATLTRRMIKHMRQGTIDSTVVRIMRRTTMSISPCPVRCRHKLKKTVEIIVSCKRAVLH